jgi:acetyl esterase/lipase
MIESESTSATVQEFCYREIEGLSLLARLYRPKGSGPFPAVVSLHGGRWTAEDRLTNAAIDQTLAGAGIAVMAIDWRMPPRVRYPVPVADINYAIRWLKLNAKRFGIGVVGGIGTSSGGHQLLLAGMRPTDQRYAAMSLSGGEGVDGSLAFMVACWPVSDPVARFAMAREKQMEIHVKAHLDYWPDDAAAADGSPQLILERREPVELPPTLIIQGTSDVILTPDMNDRFAAAYEKAGGSVRLEKFEGQPHTFITKEPSSPASLEALERIKTFILRQN